MPQAGGGGTLESVAEETSPHPHTPAQDHPETLLETLQQSPKDEGLRERAARALALAERHAEAVATLLAGLHNLTAHVRKDALPCLCKRCLVAEQGQAEVRGAPFLRGFTVASGRVLFFWMPADLRGKEAHVADSVRSALARKLRRR